MIKVDQYEYIRVSKRIYGKSISQIQRETGHSRNTIRKVLNDEYKGYCKRKKQPYPVLGPYLKQIEQWLLEDKKQPRKQRHTARRIYNRLKNEFDYKGSEESVRRYVRQIKARLCLNNTDVFLVTDPEIGKEAEIDWGSAVALINGTRTPIKFFCMRSRYSGKHFVRTYLCEKQQAFFDAHIRAFDFFGGIYSTMVYDNLTSAIKKVLRGKKSIEQESYIRFRTYYNFTSRFNNPNSGHEKGGVEGAVGFVRRNYLVPVPRVNNIEELNEKLLIECSNYGTHKISGKDKSVNELFNEEKSYLIPISTPSFSNILILNGKVDKYSTVLVEKNHYSVQYNYVGLQTHIELCIERVKVYYEGKQIADHNRVFGVNKWVLDPHHFLEIIRKKPGAFESCRVINQWRPNWPACLEQFLKVLKEKYGETKGIKEFISVLILYKEYSEEEMESAIELALENYVSDAGGVKQILQYINSDKAGEQFSPLEEWPKTIMPDVSLYGQLGGRL